MPPWRGAVRGKRKPRESWPEDRKLFLKNFTGVQKTFGLRKMGMDFKDSFGAALSRRLYPNTVLHPKQLADATGQDVQNVYNHMGGKNAPGGAAVDAYVRFFFSMGDYDFISTIFPATAILVHKARAFDTMRAAMDGSEVVPARPRHKGAA